MGFYGNTWLNESKIFLPNNNILNYDIKTAIKIIKIKKFTILFMEKSADYKLEIETIKFRMDKENWIEKIDSILNEDYELSSIYKMASNKKYYLSYYPTDSSTYYIIFKSKIDDKYYNFMVEIEDLYKIKSWQKF